MNWRSRVRLDLGKSKLGSCTLCGVMVVRQRVRVPGMGDVWIIITEKGRREHWMDCESGRWPQVLRRRLIELYQTLFNS